MEMQVDNEGRIELRCRYYQGMIDLDNLEKGYDYDYLPDTFIIVFCCYDPFGKGEYIYRKRGVYLNENNEAVGYDGTEVIILNSKGKHGKISKELKEMFDLMNKKANNGEFAKEINSALDKSKKKWRHEYMKLDMMLHDKYNAGIRYGEDLGIKKERNSAVLNMINADIGYDVIKKAFPDLTKNEYNKIKSFIPD